MSDKRMIDKIDEDVELLARHIKMLRAIKENEPIGIIRLSEITELPKHKIRYSLRLLEKDGVIAPSPDGAKTTDLYDRYMRDVASFISALKKEISELESQLPATL
jgi:predicted transcriptional regulator